MSGRVWTCAEVLAAQPGTSIDAVAGQIVTITPFRYGQNEYGGWTLQNIWINDGTGKLKVKLGDQAKIEENAQGAKIHIVAGTGKRQGSLIGVKVDTDNYKGQVSKMISVNGNAQVSFVAPGSTGQQRAANPPPPPPSQQVQDPDPADYRPAESHSQPPVQQAQQAQPDPSKPAAQLTNAERKAKWAKFDSAVNKMRRMRLRSLMVAHRIAEDAKRMGINVDAQHVEKIDSWISIECCRNGLVIDVPDCDPPTPAGTESGTN